MRGPSQSPAESLLAAALPQCALAPEALALTQGSKRGTVYLSVCQVNIT